MKKRKDSLKRKIVKFIMFASLLVILTVPIKKSYFDGGTITYTSLTYKIIYWHRTDSYYSDGYKTGNEVHIFPTNFKSLDYYAEQDIHPSGIKVIYNDKSINADIGTYEWCNKYHKCTVCDSEIALDYENFNTLKVNKNSNVKLLNAKISWLEVFKNNYETPYTINEYDDEHFVAPSESGRYLFHIHSDYTDTNNVEYYFAIEVE